MKILGKVDIKNISEEDKTKYFSMKQPIYDMKSCSCQFGYNCDEDIPIESRIVGWTETK